MSLHSSSSVNGKGSTPKDTLSKILEELRSLKLWKEKQERKGKRQKKKSGKNKSRWKRENKGRRKKENTKRVKKRKTF